MSNIFKIVNFQHVQKLLQCLKAAAPSKVSFKIAAHFDSMCQWGRCANKVSDHRHIVGEVVNAEQVRVLNILQIIKIETIHFKILSEPLKGHHS